MRRTFTESYNYNVYNIAGDGSLILVSAITVKEPLRSDAKIKQALAENGLDTKCVVVGTGTNTKTYEFDDELVLQHGKLIAINGKEIKEGV